VSAFQSGRRLAVLEHTPDVHGSAAVMAAEVLDYLEAHLPGALLPGTGLSQCCNKHTANSHNTEHRATVIDRA